MKHLFNRKEIIQKQARYYEYADHGISPKQINKTALRVTRQLRQQGYEAYIVGGCLRDLLLGRHPKDFDVATNARPKQAKKILPQAIIIGRRFQLVHVRHGDHIIEVSTFRAMTKNVLTRLFERLNPRRKNYVAENTFGTMAEDAYRRDLTINALYYDPDKRQIIDYVDAMADVRSKTARILGNTEARFVEDPMRMIRVLRFAAKLKLKLAEDIAPAIQKLRAQIERLPNARLFDEFVKLFFTSHGLASYAMLRKHDLLRYFFALNQEQLGPNDEEVIQRALMDSDMRLKSNIHFTPVFLISVLLWFPYKNLLDASDKKRTKGKKAVNFYEKHRLACRDLFTRQREVMLVPLRYQRRIEKIWRLQHLLLRYDKQNPQKIVENKNFRIAYDLLKILTIGYPAMRPAKEWWNDYQQGDPSAGPIPVKQNKDAGYENHQESNSSQDALRNI